MDKLLNCMQAQVFLENLTRRLFTGREINAGVVIQSTSPFSPATGTQNESMNKATAD